MENDYKKYLKIIGISLTILLFEILLFKIQGAIGLLICIGSMYFIVGSIIKLLILSNTIKNDIIKELDILFFIK